MAPVLCTTPQHRKARAFPDANCSQVDSDASFYRINAARFTIDPTAFSGPCEVSVALDGQNAPCCRVSANGDADVGELEDHDVPWLNVLGFWCQQCGGALVLRFRPVDKIPCPSRGWSDHALSQFDPTCLDSLTDDEADKGSTPRPRFLWWQVGCCFELVYPFAEVGVFWRLADPDFTDGETAQFLLKR